MSVLIAPCHLQDEHKRLEDSEKRSRETLADRLQDILINMDDTIEEKEHPETQKSNVELDDWYV